MYWARFDNVFGERFETRNPTDPTMAAEFKPIDPSDLRAGSYPRGLSSRLQRRSMMPWHVRVANSRR